MRFKRKLEEAMQAKHEPVIPTDWTNEDLIAEWQKRVMGSSSVKEGKEITARFAEACRNSQPCPLWVLTIRALVARIHLLEAAAEREKNDAE